MAQSIFDQRSAQLQANAQATSLQAARGRRVAARRQVLSAYSYQPPSTPSGSTGSSSATPTGGGGANVGLESATGSTSTSNMSSGTLAAAGLIAATSFDDDISAARELTSLALGYMGIAGIPGFVASTLAGVAAQAGSPVGTVSSSAISDFLGFATVNTPTGLQAVSTRDNPTAAYERVNPEIAMAHRQTDRDNAQAAAEAAAASASNTAASDGKGTETGMQGGPGAGGSESSAGGSGGPSGGSGGVGEGGGVGL